MYIAITKESPHLPIDCKSETFYRMKKLKIYVTFILTLGLNPFAVAQSMKDDLPPFQKIKNELLTKMPEIQDGQISLEKTKFGFKAKFSKGFVEHLAFYNEEGIYQETLKKTPWNDAVAPIIKMEFGHSDYNLFTVVNFWENISQETDDYYFELRTPEGETQFVWADDNGKFSPVPLFINSPSLK